MWPTSISALIRIKAAAPAGSRAGGDFLIWKAGREIMCEEMTQNEQITELKNRVKELEAEKSLIAIDLNEAEQFIQRVEEEADNSLEGYPAGNQKEWVDQLSIFRHEKAALRKKLAAAEERCAAWKVLAMHADQWAYYSQERTLEHVDLKHYAELLEREA